MYYVITGYDTAHSLEKRRSTRAAHLERLKLLKQQQRLLTAGAFFHEDTNNPAEGGIKGSVIIAEFDNLATAKEWAAADPYVTAGVYQSVEVHAFKKVY